MLLLLTYVRFVVWSTESSHEHYTNCNGSGGAGYLKNQQFYLQGENKLKIQSYLIFTPDSDNRDIIVDIMIRIQAGRPKNRGLIPGLGNNFSRLHIIQTGSNAQPASFSIDIGDPFLGSKE
jgi:hypothetical protein